MKESIYTDNIDLSKTSRRGGFNKSKIPSEAVRSYCVSVRLNAEELQLLNIKRGSYKRESGFVWLPFKSYLLLYLRLIPKHGKL